MGPFSWVILISITKKHDVNYSNASLFTVFDESFDDLNLLQLVNFSTWSRIVGTMKRSSILDHIYVNDICVVSFTSFK